MDVDTELTNIEESQIKTAKWIKYFLKEISQLKDQLDEVKKKEDILGKSVLKLYDESAESGNAKAKSEGHELESELKKEKNHKVFNYSNQ